MAAADAGADSKTPPVGIGWGRDKFAPAPAADGIGCGRLATGARDVDIGLAAKSLNTRRLVAVDEAFVRMSAPAPAADDIDCGRLATGAPDGMPSGMGLCSNSRNDMTALGEENEDCGETPSEKMQRKSSVNQKAVGS